MTNRPYYWKSRGGWYIRVIKNGKPTQVKIGDTKAQAYDRWQEWIENSKKIQSDPTMEVLVERYLLWLDQKVETGDRSKNYVDRIRQTTTDFLVWHENLRVSKLSPLVVTDWLAQKKWESNSKSTAIQHIKGLCSWAQKNRLIDLNPLIGLEKPGPRRRETIVDEEIHYKLLKECQASLVKTDRRFGLYLVVLWHTGCRPGELASLQIENWNGSYWHQDGKSTRITGKKRVVYTPGCAATALKLMVGNRKKGPVALGRQSKPYNRNMIRLRMKRLRQKLGLEENIVAQCYRHSFAHRAVVKGIPLGTVAELLGHTSMEMVAKIYGHLDKAKEYLLKSSAEVSVKIPQDRNTEQKNT